MKKHLLTLMFLVATMLPGVMSAQSLDEYSFSTGTDNGKWINVPTSITSLINPGAGDYGVSSVINLGFSFPFGQDSYTQFSVNADGNLRLGSTVTGTSNYTTPFSSSNASINNPKINFFGCDGYCDSQHYVRYLHTADSAGDSVGVVEFCVGTYNSSYRANLYKWQVQLYHSGKIVVVYGAAPASTPGVTRQQGLCVSASDGYLIDAGHNATHFTNGSSTTIASNNWPSPGRYYEFTLPNYSCPKPTTITASNISSDGFDVSWTDTSDATSWIVILNQDTTQVSDTNVTTNSASFTGLNANTTYTAMVAGLCSNGDTSAFRTLELRTPCDAINSLPYTNDFESEATGSSTTGSVFVTCWYRINNGTSYGGYPYVGNSTSYNHTDGGSRGLYWYASTTANTYGDYQYAVLPPIDTNTFAINTLQLVFWAKSSSASNHPVFHVGVMTNPTDIATFQPVDTINVNPGSSSDWAEFTTLFSDFTGNGQYLAIRMLRASAVTCYMDDVTIEVIPACPHVQNIVVSNVQTDAADIAWEEVGSATSWYIEYGESGFSPGNGNVDMAYDTAYTISGLMPNTQYDVYVTPECDSEPGRTWQTSFHTACLALDSLPYTYSFDDDPTGTSSNTALFVNCWHRLNNGTTYGGYPYVSGTSTYAHTGAKGLYWFGSTTATTYGDYQCVVLPAVDTDMFPINTLRLRFWAKATSTSYNPVFQVGVISDPSDINTFQQVNTINVGNTTSWTEFETSFANFNGNGQYLAVKAVRPSSTWYAALDDFSISLLPTCPDMTEISSVATAGNVRLEWHSTNDSVATDYAVSYRLAGSAPGTENTISVTGYSTLLTGLEPDSSYIVTVAADCGSDGLGAPMSTTIHMQALPCAEWGEADSTMAGAVDSTYTVGTPGTSTTNVMPVNGGYHYSYANHLILASEIGCGAATINGIDFDYAGTTAMTQTTNCSIYMCHTTMTECNAFVDPTDFTLVYVGPINCTSNGWNHFTFNQGTFNYNGTSNIMVGIVKNSNTTESSANFRYQTTTSSMTHRVYNDATPYDMAAMAAASANNSMWRSNMRLTTGSGRECISQVNCMAPMASITNIYSNSISIAWIPGYQETSWDVDYRAAGASNWTSAAAYLSDDTITITGLTPSTEYEIRVGSLCGDTTIYTTLTAKTVCGAMPVPFTENFDTWSSTVADPLPNCWVKHTNYTTNYPYASTSQHHSGTKSMYMYSTSSTWTYMALPMFATAIDSLQVNFWLYKGNSSYSHELYVGVMTDPEDYTTFQAVDTVQCANINTWEAFEVQFATYTGTGRFIAFMSPDGANSYPYLDDLTVDRIPLCPRATNIQARNIGTHEATLSWSCPNPYSTYDVEYGPQGFQLGTGTLVTDIVVDSLDLFSLNVNTVYDVYVRANCPEDTGTWSFVYTFHTNCGALDTLPFFEDFEAHATGTNTSATFIPCWNRINNGTTYFGYPYVANNSSYNHTPGGSKGLYWYGSTTVTTYGDYHLAVLPAVDTDVYQINQLQLSFWTRATSTDYAPVLEVGVMTDPTDHTTFQPFDTINISGTDWTLNEISFSGFTGYGANVAIRGTRPTSYWYCNVDDVTLDLIPACPHVTNVHTSTVGLTDMTVLWTPGDSTQTDFEVRYGVAGCSPDTLTPNMVYGADTILLTGLDSNTTYTIFVRPDCGGVYTPWESFDAHTLAASPVSAFPYFCGFSGAEGNAWTLENGSQTNRWAIGSAAFNNTDSVGLYISNTSGATNDYTNTSISYVWAYRTFVMSAGEYAYSFDWRAQGESSYDYIRPFLVPASETLEAGTLPSGVTAYTFASAAAPAGWIDLSNRTTSPYVLNLQGNWQTVSGTFTVPSGTYNLVFLWANDGSGGTTPPAAIDNVMIRINTCSAPTSLNADSTTDNSISLSWHTTGTETEWLVDWGTGSATAYDSTYTITGLASSSLYSIRVYTICSVSDTSLPSLITASTTCASVSLPYTENFDSYPGTTSYSSGVYPNCWNFVLTGSGTYTGASYEPYVYSSTTYANSGSNSLRLYGVGIFSLPPVDVPLDSVQLSFANYTTSTSYGLEVGVLEGNTFVPVQDVSTPASSHVSQTIYFSSYTGSSRVIAFRSYYTTSSTIYYSYNYLDDIEVNYAPTCMPVYNVISPSASETSLVLDWNDASTSVAWQIEYGPVGHTLGSATGTIISATSHPVTIAGLDTLTYYDFYIRPICSGADTGYWSQAYTFSTAICSDAHITNIGSVASTSTANNTPVNNFYKYSLTQTIIDSAELAGPQEISMISYYYQHTAPSTKKTLVDIYIQPTNKTTFSSNTDAIVLDTTIATKVYSGALNCTQGWNDFALTTPYNYDGNGNLVVIVDDNSNQYDGSTFVFKTDACTGNKTLAYYSDSENPNPFSPSSFTASTKYVYTNRVVMKLTSCNSGASCNAPVISGVSHDYESATITWSGNGTSYEVAAMPNGTATWPAEIAVTGNSYTFNGLMPATAYQFRVRQDCSVDSLGYSDWTYGTFTTDSLPCFAPSAPVASNITNAEATIAWTANGEESNWEIHVWASGVSDQNFTVNTNPATVNGLVAGVTYSVAVRALCGSALIEGDWSDTATFTTLTCPDVTGLATSNVTFNSVDLSWSSNAMAQSYVVEYGYAGFNQGQGTTVNVNTNSYTVTGLMDETNYDFYVRAVCGADWTSENWAHVSATTAEMPADVYTVTLLVNDPAMGTVAGAGSYAAGTTVTISATPNAGFQFVNWSDGNAEATRSIVVNENITLTANFATIEGIDEVNGASCTIYPNPATSSTTINVAGVNGKVRISVVDMNGRVVATDMLECSADCVKTMDVDNLAQGAYFVRITGENVNMVKKLVVR